MMREVRRDAFPGIPILLALIAVELAAVVWLIWSATRASAAEIIAASVVIVTAVDSKGRAASQRRTVDPCRG